MNQTCKKHESDFLSWIENVFAAYFPAVFFNVYENTETKLPLPIQVPF